MNQYNVGRFISKLRKENNLTQRDLANKLGITNQAVSKWERGENMPDISTLMEISKIFNVTVDELLNGERSVNTEPAEDNITDNEQIVEVTKNHSVNQSKEESSRSRVLIAISTALYACSPISFFLFDNNGYGKLVVFFIIIGIATFIRMVSSPQTASLSDENINKPLRHVSSIIYSSAVILFFIIGYLFNAWRTTWIIFLFAALIVNILEYFYENKHNK